MLRALGILGTPDNPDQYVSVGKVPLTPITPTRARPNPDRRARMSNGKKPLIGSGHRLSHTPTKNEIVVGPSTTSLQITPRRSQRLVDKNVLPPTPESLPSRSPRSSLTPKRARNRNPTSVGVIRRTKRKTVVLDAPVLIDPELAGPIGKIHLIQGE